MNGKVSYTIIGSALPVGNACYDREVTDAYSLGGDHLVSAIMQGAMLLAEDDQLPQIYPCRWESLFVAG
jgi:hypothetical protein